MKSDANTFENRLGATLKELRIIAGLTQSEMANAIKLGISSVAHYECGINIPPIKVLSAYADYFGTSVDYLLGRIPVDSNYKVLTEKANKNITYGEILSILLSLPEKKRNAYIDMLIVLSE